MNQGDSDDSILRWQRYVCNISTTITVVVNHQPQTLGQGKPTINKRVELAQTLEEDWEDVVFSSSAPIKSYISKDICKERNLGTEETPKIITIYEKMSKIEWKCWYNFLKKNTQVFAWTYKGYMRCITSGLQTQNFVRRRLPC